MNITLKRLHLGSGIFSLVKEGYIRDPYLFRREMDTFYVTIVTSVPGQEFVCPILRVKRWQPNMTLISSKFQIPNSNVYIANSRFQISYSTISKCQMLNFKKKYQFLFSVYILICLCKILILWSLRVDELIRKVSVIKKTIGLCNAPCVANIVLRFRSANL